MRLVAELFAPRFCPVCGETLSEEENYVCGRCLSDLPLTRYQLREHNPMADRFNEAIQRHIKSWEPYCRATALFFYRDGSPYTAIPRELKYRRNLGAGEYFSRLLAETLASSPFFAGQPCTEPSTVPAPEETVPAPVKGNAPPNGMTPLNAPVDLSAATPPDVPTGKGMPSDPDAPVDLIVPVPLHWTRMFRRGYNQAEVIARTVALHFPGARVDTGLLVRKRHTVSQTKLSVEAKYSNVRGAFTVRKSRLKSPPATRHILLIDDVFTTGATLAACHEALRSVYGQTVRISAATLAAVETL